MENNSLVSVSSFGELVLSSPFGDVATDYAEIALDLLFQDGSLFEQVPIVKTGISFLKAGKLLHERAELKKQLVFLQQFSRGNPNQKELERRKKAYRNGEKWFFEEVERLALYLSKQIDYQKAKITAELYIDLLNGRIENYQFNEYLDVVDRLFVSDIAVLEKHYTAEKEHDPSKLSEEEKEMNSWRPKCDAAPCNRLAAIGLLNALHGMRYGFTSADYYDITPQGQYFAEVIQRLSNVNSAEVGK